MVRLVPTQVVQEALAKYYTMANEGPSLYMNELSSAKESLRMKMADLAGCSPDEIAINRNSTEALNTVILGLNLKAGDEILLCKQDYPHMLTAWKQREKRDGIKLNLLNLNLAS